MSRRLCNVRYWGAVLAVFLVCDFALGQPGSVQPVPPEHKYALLIGCSHYEYQAGAELKGPPNDVREMAQALTTRFGFEIGAVRQLVGWPDDLTQRPTHDNIMREFLELERNIQPNSYVVIYLSGHGIRVPIPDSQTDPLDPTNPEWDGYDEAFVAADARYTDGGLQNLIRDDEIGRCLDALRAKGAHVWAIFDCCHSGTMSRGASDEQSRELMARDLGVPLDALIRAEAQADHVASQGPAATGSVPSEGLLDSTSTEQPAGTLVAFYAAQPFETAPDLRCPLKAPDLPENYFGLMTYTTLQTLLQQRDSTRVTYRELGQLVTNRYRAERGSRGPTPTFSGDLDQEVLGLRKWPGRSQMILRNEADQWRVNAGELQGLTTGSILAVLPSAEMSPLGYLRVTQTTPTSAGVEPCEYNDHPALDVGQLRELMPCQVERRHLGDLRIRLAVRPADPDLKALEVAALNAAEQLSQQAAEFVELCETQHQEPVEWELCPVTPHVAQARYGVTIPGPRILLTRRGAAPVGSSPPGASGADDGQVLPLARAYQTYDPQDEAAFREALEADLLKIFTWQNLWRLSGRMAGNLADPSSDVKVELSTIQSSDAPSAGPPLAVPGVSNGQVLELRVKNDSTDRLWVTLLFLNSNFRIEVQPTQQLNRPGEEGDALEPIRFEITSRQPGLQAWLVIATSAEADRQEPDYSFLAQSCLGKAPKIVPAPHKSSSSPFESLTRTIAGQKGASRGAELPPGLNPTLVLRSWEVVPTSPPKP